MATQLQVPYGSLVRISSVFTSMGANVDPDSVFVQVKDPKGDITSFTFGTDAAVKRDDVGQYHYDIDCQLEGQYYYRFYSTGQGQASDEGKFYVLDSIFFQNPS